MAGFAIGALPYFLQYQQQAQQQAQQKQEMDMRMAAFQQQQAQMRDQQAAQVAAGNAYPRLAVPPQAQQTPQFPPQQTPAPGQPSQPMVQPGQVPQGSLGPGESQVNLPPLPPGMAGGRTGAPGTPPLPPFKPMPTSPPPQQAAQPAAIAPPPAAQPAAPAQSQGGLWSIQDVIKAGQDQGLEGKALFDYMQIMQPVMDTQAKMQANQLQQQFNRDFKVAQLDATQQYHEDMLKSHDLDRTQRAQHEDALLGVQQQRLAMEAQRLGIERQRLALQGGGAPAPADTGKVGADGLPAPVGGGGLSGEAVRALAERQKAGDPTWSRGLSRPAIAAVNNDVAKLGITGADVAGGSVDYAAARKGAQAATQREANISTSEKAIINPGGLADQVLDAARKTYRTGSPMLNRSINNVLANYGGDPAVIDLKNALGDLEGQFNKAMAGGGAATDSARAETIARINDAQTLPQLEAAINRMKLGLRKEAEAAQESTKMYSDRVREAGKVGKKAEAMPGAPAKGTVEGGYRFKGGDPSKQENWEKV